MAQPLAMAVLVQRLVEAESSGVAFSVDPGSGAEQVVIEAAFGLGETVACGEADVDRYVVSRETCRETEPAALGHKERRRLLAAEGGVQVADVPLDMRDARVLSPKQAGQVAETVLAVERLFGCSQDMEWAWAEGHLFVLQARPITATAASFFTDVLPSERDIWTAGFLNERFPAPVSPLGWSLARELLEELAFRDPLRYLGVRDTERLRITRLYRGHPYVNLFVFQTLYRILPASLLPEDAARYFPGGAAELRLQAPYPRSVFDPRFLLSMLRHFAFQPAVWSPWHNHRVWAAFVPRHELRTQELHGQLRCLRDSGGSHREVLTVIARAQELSSELLAIHRWSLTWADLTYGLVVRLLRKHVGREEALRLSALLVSGLPNRSKELDSALRALARLRGAPGFGEALADFLGRYGHRSFGLDIFCPPFADYPQQVFDLLAIIGVSADLSGSPQADLVDREEALQTALRPMGGAPQRALFLHVMGLARRYVSLREEQRFYWQKTLALQRRLFLLLGENMARAGFLDEAGQVFFLTKAELETCSNTRDGATGLAALAAARERQFARLRHEQELDPSRSYPPFLRGNRPLNHAPLEAGTRFDGRPVSPGLARGRAVIVHSPPELGRVRRGDVLVVRCVDPGWTPVFGLLSALVMEHGGQLSHGSVVAREYGLPTVAGVSGITTLVRDGDMLLVDGTTGTVVKL